MSIIQSIRDKAAPVVIGVIALSLIGFILMDAGRRGFGSNVSPKDAIGAINGESVSYEQFMAKIKQNEQAYEMNGRTVDENTRQQIYGDTWRQLIETTLLDQEFAKLGIAVSDKEFNDLLFGKNPPEFLKQQFTNPSTGEFDVAAAKQAINELKKSKNSSNRDMVNQFYLDPLVDGTKRQKFFALVQNSAYIPKWMAEKTIADNALIASLSFVAVPYSTVPDSTVKVSDEQIMEYVKKHKSEFEQDEKSRSIAYVSFSFSPSAADTAEVLKNLNDLKEEFRTAADPGAFITRNGSTLPFFDGYNSKNRIQIPEKDSIVGAGVGNVYGPYLDVQSYVLSRVVDVKTLPDSVRAKHILIGTYDPRTQQPKLDDSTAKKKIDSVQALINGGADFDALARVLSDDEGSKEKGGDLGYFAGGAMVKEFNDFCFEKKTGDMGVVKTQFGYHLIKIVDQKNFAPAYKIAYLAKPIEASQATINDALNKANVFAGNSRDFKAFESNITKGSLNKLIAQDIKENDYSVPALGVSRALVRDIFKADVGDVLEPFELNNQFVVVAVTGEEKKGLPSVAKARPLVESIVRNEQKAKVLTVKMSGATALEALSQKVGQPVQKADSVSFVTPLLPGAGYEMKPGGYAFYKNALNKVSTPIAGTSGVYVVRVDAAGTKVDPTANVEDLRKNLLNQQRGNILYSSFEALRKSASIDDKRSKFL
jgi:peptidyl-prolyl cis-trans isomerase D